MEIVKEVFNLVASHEEISSCIEDIHPHVSETFKACYNQLETTLNMHSHSNIPLHVNNSLEIKLAYAYSYIHDHLNIGKWSEVPEHKRRAFSSVCFLKCCFSVKDGSISNLRDALAYLDNGYLMGLPSGGNPALLTDSARVISKYIRNQSHSELKCDVEPNIADKSRKRKRVYYDSYCHLNGAEISVLDKPSIEEFSKKCFSKMLPAKLKDCMSHWPALTKWLDVAYILEKAGERTVPIELGSYSADNFSQKLMTVKDYVKKFYFGAGNKVAYLAQHDLLSQVPELKEDISIPDYCCISRNPELENDLNLEPEICAWFGPKNTVSALHHDPKDNLLCQIYGTKQIILYNPSDSEYLYPHAQVLLANTAQVNPALPDLANHPEFAKAKMFKCLLEAGEMLYIPPKWWHHVTALEKSFSINFWWQ